MDLKQDYLAKPLYDELALMFDEGNYQWYYQKETGLYMHTLYDRDMVQSDSFQVIDQIFRKRCTARAWTSAYVQALAKRTKKDSGLVINEPRVGEYTAVFYLTTCNAKTKIGDEKFEFVGNQIVEFSATESYSHESFTDDSDRAVILTLNYF
ncbi:hypothetical protein [Synechococcus phage S-E7]|jgi:hypothetical protein|uniref:Uncharacterized protein n=2 Tax=Leucotheavirus TaxID=2733109 RepID=M4SN50_9CAUD|nr:DNA endonuclease V [Synechococcus phage Syn30]YP_009816141.1 DNA endonuclease V [Synechococcus phage S-P4]AGH56166.1 hypothetical protein CPRG_00082 [Synechococcus phage Syn30]AYR01956.1 hypothetical protein [Synechococcus phage S-P4]AYR02115.1 hypothetical protein [Synechococcus phage S-E7]|tara:strand:- start:50 stop:505 length:456 start_codon:yes stop_codon:yes gene_type:complete